MVAPVPCSVGTAHIGHSGMTFPPLIFIHDCFYMYIDMILFPGALSDRDLTRPAILPISLLVEAGCPGY